MLCHVILWPLAIMCTSNCFFPIFICLRYFANFLLFFFHFVEKSVNRYEINKIETFSLIFYQIFSVVPVLFSRFIQKLLLVFIMERDAFVYSCSSASFKYFSIDIDRKLSISVYSIVFRLFYKSFYAEFNYQNYVFYYRKFSNVVA